jgi:hypothetical protein
VAPEADANVPGLQSRQEVEFGAEVAEPGLQSRQDVVALADANLPGAQPAHAVAPDRAL